MPLGDIYKCETFFDFQGNLNNVYIWYLLTTNDATFGTNEEAINQYFNATAIPELQTKMHVSKVFKCISTKLVLKQDTQIPVTSISREMTVAITGGDSLGAALPGQCSMVVQTIKDLNEANPSDRGRDFFTGFVEADQVDGVWAQARQDEITASLNVMFPGGLITANGFVGGWVNWSEKKVGIRKAAPGPVFPVVTADIIFLRPLNHVRTQRRRQAENPCDKYGTILEII